MSKWNEKQAKKAEFAMNKELDSGYGAVDFDSNANNDARDAAMGKGEAELFEKKLSKEEKKALAAAKRESKRKAKAEKDAAAGKTPKEKNPKGKKKNAKKGQEEKKEETTSALDLAKDALDSNASEEAKREAALEKLSQDQILVTYESKKGSLHANTRDINVGGVTVTFHGKPLIEETEVVINYGNRYGFIGPNGSGKSTIMKAIAARAIPIPDALDIYFLDREYEATEKTALEAVMESNDEVARLEKRAEQLNDAMAEANEDEQAEIQHTLESIYDRLDALDASAAEARATSILHGLGFTTGMQSMKTREFSGGWRMRVALARALFLPTVECLVLDEPTNHCKIRNKLELCNTRITECN
jgi:ATP-binding cassette subfamily F protein 2